jgi:peptide/nickel transport system substrate-binding protein
LAGGASRAVVLSLLVATAGCNVWCSRDRSAVQGSDPAGPVRGGAVVASLRSDPGNYNRYFEAGAAADLLALLTQARLVRINRATDALEPALAEAWTTTDGLTFTIRLRPGVKFSDGAPFTSADVVFSFKAAYDAPGSVMGSAIRVAGKPCTVAAPDPATVILTLPEPFAPAMRILDNLPILPRHKLQAAFDAQTMKDAWTPGRPVSDVVGLGPFVLTEHASGQRLVLTRNPHYWRRDEGGVALPYLDRLTLLIAQDQNAEALRLEAGTVDLMANADIRPDDYARFRQLRDQGRLQLLDGGIGLDPNVLWFNLKPRPNDRKPWMRRKEFRQALSYAADRQALADTVYLGAAVPVYGPITPRNATWFSASAPTYPHDRAKARELLESIGLRDADGDGMLEDAAGRPARFSVLVQQGATARERIVSALQEQFRAAGIGVDIVGLDVSSIFERWLKGDYDSVFHGFQASATDPAMSLDFWLSSSPTHFWNPSQPVPATPWERRMDELMQQNASGASLQERQRLFAEVQRIFGEELPALYFVVPKVTIAASTRVRNLQPVPQAPQLLWSADSIWVSSPRQP